MAKMNAHPDAGGGTAGERGETDTMAGTTATGTGRGVKGSSITGPHRQ